MGLEEFINAVVLVENATGTAPRDSGKGRRGEMLICITMRPVGERAGAGAAERGRERREGAGRKGDERDSCSAR